MKGRCSVQRSVKTTSALPIWADVCLDELHSMRVLSTALCSNTLDGRMVQKVCVV
jgi:hypothetical protein